jgi:long-chain acyl-CoA synthetase
VSVNLLERNDPASIGLVLPGITIAFSEKNELLVKGPNVMMGYWNNPEATALVKSEAGWLNTGDQARIENDFLYITGRVKEIIVLGNGEKVPPVDMELAIQLDPLMEQALVIGEGKAFLAALISLNMKEYAELAKANNLPADPNGEGRERAEKFVVARVAERIKGFPGYAQIRKVALITDKWTVDNGMLTATLKIKRAPILERYKEQVDAVYKTRGA